MIIAGMPRLSDFRFSYLTEPEPEFLRDYLQVLGQKKSIKIAHLDATIINRHYEYTDDNFMCLKEGIKGFSEGRNGEWLDFLKVGNAV